MRDEGKEGLELKCGSLLCPLRCGGLRLDVMTAQIYIKCDELDWAV